MKRVLGIIFILCCVLSSRAQLRFDYSIEVFDTVLYIVKYDLSYQQDSLNNDFLRHDEMELHIGNSVSIFVGSCHYYYDTILRQISNHEQFSEFCRQPAPCLSSHLYTIFKNQPEGQISNYERIMPNNYLVKEPLGEIDWILHNETDSLGEYTIRKATCDYGGRSWVAWYTPEIPISDGPYKFHGLPGLILNISDTRNHYVFTFESINEPNSPLYVDLVKKEYIEVSKQEFMQAEDNWRENTGSFVRQAGVSKENQQKAVARSKVWNNPLELDRN